MPRVLLEFGYNHRRLLGVVGGVEESVTSTGSSRVTSTVVDRANATRLTTTVFSGNTNARIEKEVNGHLISWRSESDTQWNYSIKDPMGRETSHRGPGDQVTTIYDVLGRVEEVRHRGTYNWEYITHTTYYPSDVAAAGRVAKNKFAE